MSAKEPGLQRSAIGVIALALLLSAAVCHWFGQGGTAAASALGRVGVVLAMLWLALPELSLVRGKLVWVLLAGAMGLLLLKPKLAPVVLLFCAVYAVLRMRR
ncbi:MAG TPA: hypothetical protein VF278_07175 [Pirellulales bacterium]